MPSRSRYGNAKFWKQLDVVRTAFRLPDDFAAPQDVGSHSAMEIAVARTPAGAPDFAYQSGVILVRAVDAPTVVGELERARHLGGAAIPLTNAGRANAGRAYTGRVNVERADEVIPLDIGDRRVLETLDHLDEVLGEGRAAPNHILSICPVSLCPADEPTVPRDPAPDPGVGSPGDGLGKVIEVIDTGLVDDYQLGHPWMEGVDGLSRLPHREGVIPEYLGHGTFVAGVAKCMAPGATVHVSNALRRAGAITELDLREALSAVLNRRGPLPDIISLSAGGTTRAGARTGERRSHLGLDDVIAKLRAIDGLLLVAAAGNDDSDEPFWPAAYADGESVISVGALAEDRRTRACYSNHGVWVNVYAPGTKLVNAFTHGRYTYLHAPQEHCTSDDATPAAGDMADFTGMARWSGTSFATPLVAGLIAKRMTDTGETDARVAARKLLAEDTISDPGLGLILLPPR